MKVHVISDLPYDSKLNLACGDTIHPLSYFKKFPQPLTRLLSVDLNPEGNCDNETAFVIHFWNSLSADGNPDSYLKIDPTGKILERKERSIQFVDWKPFEPRVFQVTLKPKSHITKILVYSLIALVVLVLLAISGYFLYKYMYKKQSTKKVKIQQPEASFFKKD